MHLSSIYSDLIGPHGLLLSAGHFVQESDAAEGEICEINETARSDSSEFLWSGNVILSLSDSEDVDVNFVGKLISLWGAAVDL